MQLKKNLLLAGLFFCGLSFTANSQSLLGITDSIQKATQPPPPLESTWKDTRLIDDQTTKTVAPGVMVYRIAHRFGNMGSASAGGVHTLYGFDVASDIYMDLEFGVLKNLQVSAGRSKDQELVDGGLKYRPLTQKSIGMPISLAFYGDAGITPELTSVFYGGGTDTIASEQHIRDRLTYTAEMLIDRKFGNVGSLELIAGFNHRNYVLAIHNTTNNSRDSNNIAYFGTAGKIRLTKHAALVFEYTYIMSAFRTDNTAYPYYNQFSVGYEIETGGHVFEINLSNASYLNENNSIPSTTDTWTKGGFKLGFCISRAFNI